MAVAREKACAVLQYPWCTKYVDTILQHKSNESNLIFIKLINTE